ncbi:ubiquitin-conjugating enzyme [Aureococcus anophagefferens]|uniref:Ubiquitin-conjugating enzyme n=1 Tax=Aureococcus anophagefferens TaxID=44056 RepID=A0ABR1G645_AURAN
MPLAAGQRGLITSELRVKKDLVELASQKFTCPHASARHRLPEGDILNMHVTISLTSGFYAGARAASSRDARAPSPPPPAPPRASRKAPAGGSFALSLRVPANYPFRPPSVYCLTRVWHPNVCVDGGRVSHPLLDRDWKPVLSINTVIFGLQLLFLEPNPSTRPTARRRGRCSRTATASRPRHRAPGGAPAAGGRGARRDARHQSNDAPPPAGDGPAPAAAGRGARRAGPGARAARGDDALPAPSRSEAFEALFPFPVGDGGLPDFEGTDLSHEEQCLRFKYAAPGPLVSGAPLDFSGGFRVDGARCRSSGSLATITQTNDATAVRSAYTFAGAGANAYGAFEMRGHASAGRGLVMSRTYVAAPGRAARPAPAAARPPPPRPPRPRPPPPRPPRPPRPRRSRRRPPRRRRPRRRAAGARPPAAAARPPGAAGAVVRAAPPPPRSPRGRDEPALRQGAMDRAGVEYRFAAALRARRRGHGAALRAGLPAGRVRRRGAPHAADRVARHFPGAGAGFARRGELDDAASAGLATSSRASSRAVPRRGIHLPEPPLTAAFSDVERRARGGARGPRAAAAAREAPTISL